MQPALCVFEILFLATFHLWRGQGRVFYLLKNPKNPLLGGGGGGP